MLIELREVEVYIEPEDILSKALKEGDLDVRSVVRECVYEESIEAVLDAIDPSEIQTYCERHDIGTDVGFDAIATKVVRLSNQEKAQLLWLLLKCEG